MTGLLDPTARAALRVVASAQAAGRVPSLAAGVVRDAELVWSTGRGRAVRRDDDARPDSDTQYKIGSVTKTMTAALVLLARERGDLDLSDRLGRFLPDGPYADATLRSMLSHAAGITAEPHGTWWERSEGGSLSDLLAAHTGAEPVLEPGSQLHYSNLGFGLLGAVVEQVTGESWWDTLRHQVLEPLALARTTYEWAAPHAEGFAVDALSGELVAEPLPDTGALAPAGQLWSTVGDLATWLTALVDPERPVLSAASLAAMRTPQVGAPGDRSGTTWGLGVSLVADRGRLLLGHGGSMPGFSCGALIDVDSGTGAVVLSNAAYGLGGAARDLLDTVLDLEPAVAHEWTPTPGPVPPGTREILGTWHWGHAPSVVRWDGRLLHLAPASGPGRVMAFAPVGGDAWVGVAGYLTGETLRVVRTHEGAVSHLEVATFVYTRVPYDPRAPIPGG